jgi:hypothetical protein
VSKTRCWRGIYILIGCLLAIDGSAAGEVTCGEASSEALPAFMGATECLGETDSGDIEGLDACIAKTRNALSLIEYAEEMCAENTLLLPQMRFAKAQILEHLLVLEKTQAYNRGEIDAADVVQEILKD